MPERVRARLQVEHLYVLCGGHSHLREGGGMLVWRYQLGAHNWEQCTPPRACAEHVPRARHQCCVVLADSSRWLVHGGISSDGRLLSDSAEFDFQTHAWRAVALTNPHVPGTSEHAEVSQDRHPARHTQ